MKSLRNKPRFSDFTLRSLRIQPINLNQQNKFTVPSTVRYRSVLNVALHYEGPSPPLSEETAKGGDCKRRIVCCVPTSDKTGCLLSHLSACLDLAAVVCRAAVGVCARRAALPRPPAARALRSRYSLPVGA